MKARTLLFVIAILSALFALNLNPIAFAAAPDDKSTQAAVQIDNFSFSPTTITVPVGTTVVWTNRDDIPHTIVGDDKSFQSRALDTDEHFSYTFTKPGTYGYFCGIHPKMTAKIVVR